MRQAASMATSVLDFMSWDCGWRRTVTLRGSSLFNRTTKRRRNPHRQKRGSHIPPACAPSRRLESPLESARRSAYMGPSFRQRHCHWHSSARTCYSEPALRHQGHGLHCCSVLLAMSIDEQSLHELLASKHAAFCAQAVTNRILNGGHVIIAMSDSRIVTLTTVEQAKGLLQSEFGWTVE